MKKAGKVSFMDDLLLEIVRCKNVEDYFDKGFIEGNKCKDIIEWQKFFIEKTGKNLSKEEFRKEFRLPEPWSGYLDKAPILFISSNPSISENANSPRDNGEWTKRRNIVDYFEKRFSKGTISCDFWDKTENLAGELMGKNGISRGKDYALTEIVHCKSKDQKGVGKARPQCSGKYLKRIIEASVAEVIVCLGKHAEKTLRGLFESEWLKKEEVVFSVSCGNKERNIVFLGHPSSTNTKGRLPKTFKDAVDKKWMSQEGLDLLKEKVKK
ncbi:MAG TPA: uracil-DNA glycosylase family protein [Thermodesulfobacteriota bacterium]|nr:uracil-DNA glycosylase family protein [Thermodesulfobacteriota bacterium]